MPRRPRFRTNPLRELFDGLRFAPAETLRRQMIAAEALAMRLEPMSLYRRSSVIHDITGFRPEGSGDRGQAAADDDGLVGQALLTDLSTFIERVSERVSLRADERPGGAVTMRDAALALGVSERSLLRYRSLGLAVHWIDFGIGTRRVGCFRESLERFRERRLADRVPRGRGAVLSDSQRESVLQSARAMAADGSIALSQATAIVASRESMEPRRVRRILESSGLPFRRQRRRAKSELRLAHRAWRRGVDPKLIAVRLGRDKAATWRAINAGRRAALRALALPPVDPLPTFEHPSAADVLLAPDAIRRGLRSRPLPPDALALLEEAPAVALPSRAGELDACRRLVAMRFLLWRSRRAIAALRAMPTSRALDRIETDLRNAASLRRSLLVHALPAALGRIEAMLGAALTQLPSERLAAAVRRAVGVTIASIDGADSLDAAEGRLRTARHAALLMDRDLALAPVEAIARRATLRAVTRVVPLADLEAIAAPWSAVLPWSAPPSWISKCSAPTRSLLERRHGWGGALALTVTELAAEERVAPSILQHRLVARASSGAE